MKHLFSTSALLLAGTGLAQADFTLHILHVNDLHSRIESVSKYDGTCGAEDEAAGECFGGVARLKTAIDAKRAELAGENVIVLDAGDQFQGSLMYTTYKGKAEAEFAAQMGFDAMAVGNHEFDDGPEALAEFIDAVNFPVVSGNLDLSGSNVLKGKVQNHVVLDVGGEKVGIVSALGTGYSQHAQGLREGRRGIQPITRFPYIFIMAARMPRPSPRTMEITLSQIVVQAPRSIRPLVR